MNLKNVAFVAGLLASTSAFAADLPARSAPASSPLAAFSWTGAYVGLVGGMAAHNSSVSDLDYYNSQGRDEANSKGFSIGGTLGYNMQSGNLVYGLEADLSYNSGSKNGRSDANDPYSWAASDLNAYGTLRARAGLAVNNTMLFLTGGAIAANIKSTYTYYNSDAPHPTTDGWNWGWVVGAGLEHALTRTVSLKAEALYGDFGSKRVAGTNDYSGYNFNFNNSVTIVRGGVNYRF